MRFPSLARRESTSEEARIKYALVLPTIVTLLVFTTYPFISQFYLSFTSASIYNYNSPPLAGVSNYTDLLYSPGLFWQSGIITTIYVGLAVLLQLLLGMLMAVLIYSMKRGQKVFTSLFMFPMFVAPVFVGALGRLIFNSMIGVVPYYLRTFGLPPISLSNPIHALLLVILMEVWKWTPFAFIILYGGLESLPAEIFDAAKVDGASGPRTFLHVTLPMLKSIIVVVLIIRIMDELKAFDIPFILLEGGPGAPVGATTIFSLLVYKLAFSYNNFGAAAAVNVLLLFILLGLFWIMIQRLLK